MIRRIPWYRGGAILLAFSAVILSTMTVGATNASLTVNGSGSNTCGSSEAGLTMNWTTPTFALGTVTLNGSNQAVALSDTLQVDDNSGCGSGWNVTATGTEFLTGTSTYITNAPSFPAPSWTCTNGVGTCTLPTNTSSPISYPYSMPVGATAPAATKLVSADAGTGMGDQQSTENISFVVPGSAYAGSYAATWTFTAVAGP